MDFHFINLLPPNWINALCLTLFHSLWMGLILALITSVIIITTRQSKASYRYNLLTGVLFLFIIGMGFLFYQSLQIDEIKVIAPVVNSKVGASSLSSPARATPALISNVNSLVDLYSQYASQIVLIWFLIICAKSIQLLAGLNSVYVLKHSSVFDAGRKWDNKVNELAARLGIAQGIKILQSGLAKVPMVAGHFKPIILVPLGMLNSLSIAEIEAILSHELAHIKRKDYLVNILQSLIEIIFFFNPAVLWITKLIREERENCCDDLALSCTNSKQEYIKALISCQEFQSVVPKYAMAVIGKKSQLLERVSRILFNKSSSLNQIEKTVLTVALVFTLIFTAAFTKTKTANQNVSKIEDSTMVNLQDTIVRKNIKKKKAAKYVKKRTQVIVSEYSSDEEEARHAKEEAKYAKEEAKYAKEEVEYAKKEAILSKVEVDAMTEEARVSHQEAAGIREEVIHAQEEARSAKQEADYAMKAAISAEKGARLTLKKYRNVKFPVPQVPAIPAVPYNSPRPPKVPSSPVAIPSAPKPPKVPTENFSTTSTNKVSTTVSITTDKPGGIPDETNFINAEMAKDGLIKKNKSLTYILNNQKLEINGVRQPKSIHQKYKAKYLTVPNTSIVYNYQLNNKDN